MKPFIIRYVPEVQCFTSNGDYITDEKAREIWDNATGDWTQLAYQKMSEMILCPILVNS